ncbi:MAG: hypothetical protein L7U50_04655, partial [Candidatus Nanopelagicales bacterium]|nr:hypothetical protein [Candidatus Nanopelagicales bacterium]
SRVVLPLTVASAIWYGSLVRLGVVAGRNLVRLEELLAGIHRGLALVAVLVSLLIGLWWYRTRIPGDDQ